MKYCKCKKDKEGQLSSTPEGICGICGLPHKKLMSRIRRRLLELNLKGINPITWTMAKPEPNSKIISITLSHEAVDKILEVISPKKP